MFILRLLFVIPAVIISIWTVLTLLAAWVMPLNRPFPAFFGAHPMMMTLNVMDKNLSQRPGWGRTVLFLAIGVLPVVSLLLLAWMGYCAFGIPTAEAKLRKSRNKAST
jgi:hypothetical protein